MSRSSLCERSERMWLTRGQRPWHVIFVKKGIFSIKNNIHFTWLGKGESPQVLTWGRGLVLSCKIFWGRRPREWGRWKPGARQRVWRSWQGLGWGTPCGGTWWTNWRDCNLRGDREPARFSHKCKGIPARTCRPCLAQSKQTSFTSQLAWQIPTWPTHPDHLRVSVSRHPF